MKQLILVYILLFGYSIQSQTLKEILDVPMASDLTVSNDGSIIAWVDNIAGQRNFILRVGLIFLR